jgi:hypothetical protein
MISMAPLDDRAEQELNTLSEQGHARTGLPETIYAALQKGRRTTRRASP